MKTVRRDHIVIVLLMVAFAGCRQLYIPPEVKAGSRMLVVDGFIDANPGDSSFITLSHTRSLTDSIHDDPETAAQVLLQGKRGAVFVLQEKTPGLYVLANASLDRGDVYSLRIVTADRREYQSDYVPVKTTPPIDSISWKQPDDLTIFANTHDPQNNTWYYRWDYTETWEYHATLETILTLKNGLIYYTDSTDQIFKCWHTAPSTDIVLGTSLKLSNDVIQNAPVAVIPQHAEKAAIRYSMLLKQYALTEDAYRYFSVLQKNTQALGSLFGGQPGQLKGNFHSVLNPSEPVIGFLCISTVTTSRFFIDHNELSNWHYNSTTPGVTCDLVTIPQDPANWQIYNYQDTTYAPYYFVSGGIVLTRKTCLDCRLTGGTNLKPVFW